MTKTKAYELFHNIYNEFKAVKSPIYKNIDRARIEILYDDLLELKPLLNANVQYSGLINAISQVKKKQLLNKSSWRNLSERGINKAIKPFTKKNNPDIDLPFSCEDDKTGHSYSVNGYWGEKNYMVADVLGYFFLLNEGGDRLPKTMTSVFDNAAKVSEREQDFNNNVITHHSGANYDVSNIYSSARYKISFTDKQFRQFTGTSMSSDAIEDLVHKTSSVEFKIAFPMRFEGNPKPHEEHYVMNIFSRLFEFGYSDVKVRSDGVVTSRKYFVIFNTILGEMFVHNLLMKNYDFIDNSFYKLPVTAQLLYRKFLQHNNYPDGYLNLIKIVAGLNLRDSNPTNLKKTIEDSALGSLQRYGYIESFTVEKGLHGRKYRIIKTKRDK